MSFSSEVPKRLPVTIPVRQRLFALSGNSCAFPSCTSKLVTDDGVFVGQICHIEAAALGGERFNPLSNNEARRGFDNLLLLCYACHQKTNDVVKYPVEVMRDIKSKHESHTSEKLRSVESERFVDQSLWQEITLPANYGAINVPNLDEGFMSHAAILLDTIAKLPLSTRSFYAQAFIKAFRGDLYLVGNLSGLLLSLNKQFWQVEHHLGLLQEKNLLCLLEAEDDWRKLTFPGMRYFLSGLDREDFGIYLLYLIKERFEAEEKKIIDIFELLDFSLLDS